MKSNISAPLAEFVGALVVIAMLSVFVIEQLEYRQAERRSASLDGLAGSIRSTAALAHSVWIDSKSADPHVAFGDSHAMEIDLLTGYPSANQHGIEISIHDLSVFEGDNKGTVMCSLFGESSRAVVTSPIQSVPRPAIPLV